MSSVETERINPAYHKQDGYDTTNDKYPPDWNARSKAVRKRDDYICQDCGVKSGYHTPYGEGVTLDVHHITFLSDGGSNRFDNLTTLCVDCHNDRHEHDITEGRDVTTQTPSGPLVWLRQLVRYSLGSVGVLLLHTIALSLLVTQPTGEPLYFAGGGYIVLLTVAGVLRTKQTAILYALAGGIGMALMQVPFVVAIIPVSRVILVCSTWIPALLTGIWWWHQRK
ncbi:HNH endonuclease [Halocatena marina]|uniref:HNH endonuclease n=1 Tax=Halocatena marina TaxID=2934937 RepID=UPI0022254B56|nr:HNH endonuclease [Halocatena marina]